MAAKKRKKHSSKKHSAHKRGHTKKGYPKALLVKHAHKLGKILREEKMGTVILHKHHS